VKGLVRNEARKLAGPRAAGGAARIAQLGALAGVVAILAACGGDSGSWSQPGATAGGAKSGLYRIGWEHSFGFTAYPWSYAQHVTGPKVTRWAFDQFGGSIGYAHVAAR
jgi:hypothetical protein